MEPELIESFWLYGEDGTKYQANIFRERISASALSPGSWISGPKKYLLQDGSLLNFINESTFVSAVTGERLHRRTGPRQLNVSLCLVGGFSGRATTSFRFYTKRVVGTAWSFPSRLLSSVGHDEERCAADPYAARIFVWVLLRTLGNLWLV